MPAQKTTKIYVFTAIFGSYFLLELVMSHISHSLTLLIDAYHTLYNLMALVSYIIAIKMSDAHTLKNTFGWARIEVLSVMVSVLALCAFCFSTAVEAVQTTIHASHSDAMHHPLIVLAIGVAGVVLNLICFLFIGGFSYSQSFVHVSPQEVQVSVTVPQYVIAGTKTVSTIDTQKDERKIRCKFCHDLCWDLCCSILVIICAVTVYKSDGKVALYIDPALCLVAVIILLATSYSFVKESGMILLQTIPSHMDVVALKGRLMQRVKGLSLHRAVLHKSHQYRPVTFPSIKNIHDLHIWRLTEYKVIATAHVMFESPKDYTKIEAAVGSFFREEGISHTTIQPEFNEKSSCVTELKSACKLRCEMAECKPRTCCNEQLLLKKHHENSTDTANGGAEKMSSNQSTEEVANVQPTDANEEKESS